MNMKKTYMMPSTEVLDVKIERLLTTGSELDIHTPTDEDDTVDNPDDLLSRRRNDVWDDEEEDEEQ